MSDKPNILYKYRRFDTDVLNMLVVDQMYFADPCSFNDPLDTKLTLNADVNIEDLRRILAKLCKQRIKAEMLAAAQIFKSGGRKVEDHTIDRLTHNRINSLMNEIFFESNNPAYDDDYIENTLHNTLSHAVEEELLRRSARGIFCLAESSVCPLMWSHYGDQHRGLCLGYSIPRNTDTKLHIVNYGNNREVKASDIAAMLENDIDACQRVDDVFLRKAEEWSYEKEWRIFGSRGIQNSVLELEEIVFGFKCPQAVKHTIIKALENRERQIQYYEICPQPQSYKLDLAYKTFLPTDMVGLIRQTLALNKTYFRSGTTNPQAAQAPNWLLERHPASSELSQANHAR